MSFLKTKTVTTKTEPIKNSKQIKVSQKDIDKLNQKIREDIKCKNLEQEKTIDSAEDCMMR